jgi:phosphopantetheinyl transferase (holo-ACP synthase)
MTTRDERGEAGGQVRPRPGIGLDAEQVARFDKLAAGVTPWRFVYSEGEARHLAAQPHAARAFCAAFCCKEALCKALGEAYSFPQLECRYVAGARTPQLVVGPQLRERGVRELRVSVDERFLAERGELVAEVYLVPTAAAHCESLEVAVVEAGRERIVAEHFSPAEIADLGARRVQSLAGFLALKRALARLWAGTAAAAAAAPRDFELGHHDSGAPRVVAAPPGGVPLVSISHTRAWAYGLAAFELQPQAGAGADGDRAGRRR